MMQVQYVTRSGKTGLQGRIEGGFLRFQETPFDSPIIFKTA